MRTLILIADAAEAKLLTANRSEGPYETRFAIQNPRGTMLAQHLMPDGLDRHSRSSRAGTRPAFERRGPLDEGEDDRFAAVLVQALRDELAARGYGAAAVVTPTDLLARLRGLADPRLQRQVVLWLPGDLMKVPDRELPDHIGRPLAEACRVLAAAAADA